MGNLNDLIQFIFAGLTGGAIYALVALGFKKEVHSVVKPGKQYSLTYDGSKIDKARVEEILRPLGEKNQINIMVELEESLKFP